MTPERWAAVDAILQAALACEPARRDALVASACGEDQALRLEVASLLDANKDGDDFLERPAAESLGAVPDEMRVGASAFADAARHAAPWRPPPAPPARPTAARPDVAAANRDGRELGTAPHGRTVSARAAMYAAVATLVVGLTVGLLVDLSPLLRLATDGARAVARPAADAVGAAPFVLAGEAPLTVVDRAGGVAREIPANRPWTPRFSPDGRRVAYGAFGPGRSSSDLWVTDLDAGTTRRLTDDDADANDPQWSPDGALVAYSAGASGGKDLMVRPIAGGAARVLASRDGTQFASDWLREGRALLVTEERGAQGRDILVQPADGSPARPYAATPAEETAARISPDGRWVAYTSDESGRAEVYLDSYPKPGKRVNVSRDGGIHPVWRGDGRELYYWHDGALIAVRLGAATFGAAPVVGAQVELFRTSYPGGPNTMYDVSPDGERFVIARQP